MALIHMYEADAGRLQQKDGTNPWIVMEDGYRRFFPTREEAVIYVDALLSGVNPVTGKKANRMVDTLPLPDLVKSQPKFGT